MFISIKYLNCIFDNKTKLYNYHYDIVDSEFTSIVPAVVTADLRAGGGHLTENAATEYERRKTPHLEIIKNLFLLNMFILKQNWGYKDMIQILEYQHKYLIEKYYPKTNFNEKYYDDLTRYTKKMMVIS